MRKLLTVFMLILISAGIFADPISFPDKSPNLYILGTQITKSKVKVAPKSSKYGHIDVKIDKKQEILSSKAVFPSYFNLAEEGFITPVRNQNPWGTCCFGICGII